MGVSCRSITAGQGMFPDADHRAQKHPLTCGDAPPKILSYPPTADSAVSREIFFRAQPESRGGSR